MSVIFTTVRHIRATQASAYEALDDEEFYQMRAFEYIEVVSCGWTGGARVRVKRICDIQKVFAYFNKLHIHGFLNDDSYTEAWNLALRVEENILAEKAEVTALNDRVKWLATQYEFVDPLRLMDR